MVDLTAAIEATEDVVLPVLVGLVIVLVPASFVFIARTMRTLRHVEHSVIPWFKPPEPTPHDPDPEDQTLPTLVLRGEDERCKIVGQVQDLQDRLEQHLMFEEERTDPAKALTKEFDRLRADLLTQLKEMT